MTIGEYLSLIHWVITISLGIAFMVVDLDNRKKDKELKNLRDKVSTIKRIAKSL